MSLKAELFKLDGQQCIRASSGAIVANSDKNTNDSHMWIPENS